MSKILIAHANINENGQISGGKPGDQNGVEVCVQPYFDHKWEYIIRPTDPELAEKMAADACLLAGNENVGYSQEDRYSMYTMAKMNGFDFTKINKPCCTDCSNYAATLAIANGLKVSPFVYTGNIIDALLATGKFEKYTFTSKEDLKRGDFLITVTKRHIVIVVQGAAGEAGLFSETPEAVAEVYGKTIVTVYSMPDEDSKALRSYPELGVGNLVDICDEYDDWYRIRIAGKYFGWLQKCYLLKKTPYRKGKVTSALHIRTNPGTMYKSMDIMPKGASVDICDEKPAPNGAKWYYVVYRGIYGFCSSGFVK